MRQSPLAIPSDKWSLRACIAGVAIPINQHDHWPSVLGSPCGRVGTARAVTERVIAIFCNKIMPFDCRLSPEGDRSDLFRKLAEDYAIR